MKSPVRIVFQMAVVISFSTALAFLVNWARKDGMALVMPFPPEYRCSAQLTEGRVISVEEALRLYGRDGAAFVDARAKESYQEGRIKDAINIPYSFLDAVPREAVERLRSYRMIIVYCNTANTERSRLMAGELSGAGLKGISYLEGGFLGWVKAGGPYTGRKPEGYE